MIKSNMRECYSYKTLSSVGCDKIGQNVGQYLFKKNL